MSPSSFSVYLVVAMGVVFSSGVGGRSIPDSLKHIQDSIANELELTRPEIGKEPLFSSVMKTINTSCKSKENVQLLNATLDVYMRIFSSILQHGHRHHHGKTGGLLDHMTTTKRSEVESSLTKLQKKMECLKNHISHQNHNKEDVLSELNKIKVDDPIDQKKALAEFLEIYKLASVFGGFDAAQPQSCRTTTTSN